MKIWECTFLKPNNVEQSFTDIDMDRWIDGECNTHYSFEPVELVEADVVATVIVGSPVPGTLERRRGLGWDAGRCIKYIRNITAPGYS